MNYTVEIDKEGFKGKLEIDFPTRQEKTAIIQELRKLGYGENMGKDTELTEAKLDLAARMGEEAEKRLVSLDVIFNDNSGMQPVHITDKAMLDIYSEGQVLIGIISNYILGGVSLGKEKSTT